MDAGRGVEVVVLGAYGARVENIRQLDGEHSCMYSHSELRNSSHRVY